MWKSLPSFVLLELIRTTSQPAPIARSRSGWLNLKCNKSFYLLLPLLRNALFSHINNFSKKSLESLIEKLHCGKVISSSKCQGSAQCRWAAMFVVAKMRITELVYQNHRTVSSHLISVESYIVPFPPPELKLPFNWLFFCDCCGELTLYRWETEMSLLLMISCETNLYPNGFFFFFF